MSQPAQSGATPANFVDLYSDASDSTTTSNGSVKPQFTAPQHTQLAAARDPSTQAPVQTTAQIDSQKIKILLPRKEDAPSQQQQQASMNGNHIPDGNHAQSQYRSNGSNAPFQQNASHNIADHAQSQQPPQQHHTQALAASASLATPATAAAAAVAAHDPTKRYAQGNIGAPAVAHHPTHQYAQGSTSNYAQSAAAQQYTYGTNQYAQGSTASYTHAAPAPAHYPTNQYAKGTTSTRTRAAAPPIGQYAQGSASNGNAQPYAYATNRYTQGNANRTQTPDEPSLVTDIMALHPYMFPPTNPSKVLQQQLFHLMCPQDAALVQNVQLFVFRRRPKKKNEFTFGHLSWPTNVYLQNAPDLRTMDLSAALGVRCKCCASIPSISDRPLGGSTWFPTTEESLYYALQSLGIHIRSHCPYASRALKNSLSGTNVNYSTHTGRLSLKYFVSWYCNAHKVLVRQSQQNGNNMPVPMAPPHAQFSAVRGYGPPQPPRPRLSDESFEELQDALSDAFARHFYARLGPAKEIVASDLNEIPWSEDQAESPFVAHLLECLEMVRTRSKTTDDEENGNKETETLVLLQCRYCHGTCAANNADDFYRPFLVTNHFFKKESNPGEAAAWLHVMGYGHTDVCKHVPLAVKERIRNLRPRSSTPSFAKNAQHLRIRFEQWLSWIHETILQESNDSEDAMEDVDMWIPLPGAMIEKLGNDFVEPESALPKATRKMPAGFLSHFGVRYNDVIVNASSAVEHSGNKRFRLLVSKLRRDYLSASYAGRKLIARSMVKTVRDRGGYIGTLNDNGQFHRLPFAEAMQFATRALNEGIQSLLRPITKKRGPGSLVLDCEVAPQYGVLHKRVVWPNSSGEIALDNPLRKRRTTSEDFDTLDETKNAVRVEI